MKGEQRLTGSRAACIFFCSVSDDASELDNATQSPVEFTVVQGNREAAVAGNPSPRAAVYAQTRASEQRFPNVRVIDLNVICRSLFGGDAICRGRLDGDGLVKVSGRLCHH